MPNQSSFRFLYIEIPGYKSLPATSLIESLHQDDEYSFVASQTAAESALKAATSPFTAVICNAPLAALFKRIPSPATKAILVTDMVLDKYHLEFIQDSQLVDNIVANHLPEELTFLELKTTINKFKSSDRFGISSYLAENATFESLKVSDSAQRDQILQKMSDFASGFAMRGILKKQFAIVGEELLMNAIYDAPYAAGRYQSQEENRTVSIQLKPDEEALFTYGCDGKRFAISVSDPFGLLQKSNFFQYCAKITQRHSGDKILDKKVRGAGIGIYMILYNSHSLICNVASRQRTEVIALVDLKLPIRDFAHMPRSIHYFQC